MPPIDFQECQQNGYKPRTYYNASADATLAFAVDFSTAGEKLTKAMVKLQNKVYIPINILESLVIDENDIQKVAKKLNNFRCTSINIAGNGIYTMVTRGYSFTQEKIDFYIYAFLYRLINHENLHIKINTIRSGGQTGIDEAGAKAGDKLGIKTLILAPKGWCFRDKNGIDIYDKGKFIARFEK